MLSFILILFLSSSDAQAQTAAPATPPAAKKFNTNLYEQEPEPEKEDSQSFTAKVKLVREEENGVEVFFEGEKQKGGYSLARGTEHYAKYVKDLEASRKAKGPQVSITADSEKHIKKVELKKGSNQDPNKTWDFGKIPD